MSPDRHRSVATPTTPRRSLPRADWPAGDRAAWAAALRDDDIFDRGSGAHWGASTRAGLEQRYGRWLGVLGAAATDAASPGARVTLARVEAYVTHLREDGVGERTIADYLDGLVRVCRVLDPAVPLAWVTVIAAKIRAGVPAPDNRDRLVPTAEMLALVDRLIAAGGAEGRQAALDLRDGLMLALLVHRAPRLGNLRAMTIDRHPVRTPGGLLLRFEGPDMKGRRPFTFEVPARLMPAVDRYLGAARGRIFGADRHTGLWASMHGRPMSTSAIQRMVAVRTTAAFGRPLHPHLFRTMAATTVVMEAPERIDIVPGLLHHADIRTADAHYIRADAVKASRVLGDLIDGLRG
ncbi:MAG: tyrosine recombinase XerC [Rhodospirillales bacterium]|jgi:integrase